MMSSIIEQQKWWGFFSIVLTTKVQDPIRSLSTLVLNGELLISALGEEWGLFPVELATNPQETINLIHKRKYKILSQLHHEKRLLYLKEILRIRLDL